METGYQQELTYRHPDGSFSAFGTNDPSGSTWLVYLHLNIQLLKFSVKQGTVRMEVEATDRSLMESHVDSAHHVALVITVAFSYSPLWPTSNSAEFLSLEILLPPFL
jgi:hypothetical protein